MARKRQRKKKLLQDLQVELLEDSVPESVGEPVDGLAVEPVVDPPEAVNGETRHGREGTDRWASAAGHLKPTPARDGEGPGSLQTPTRDGEVTGTVPTPGAEREPSEEESSEEDTYASARDHASAGVRSAGQPLTRARDLVAQGRVYEAIELYLGILTVNPSNLKAHNNLGVLLDELKQFEAALVHFEAAERLAPENVEVLANYASTLTSLARYEEAEELLRRAQQVSAQDVRARLGIGVLYFRRGLYVQAESELRWVVTRDADNGRAHYYRGEALNRLGRFDEAVEELQLATELIPDDPRPYYTLGHLYDRRHDLEEATEMYRQARRLQVG